MTISIDHRVLETGSDLRGFGGGHVDTISTDRRVVVGNAAFALACTHPRRRPVTPHRPWSPERSDDDCRSICSSVGHDIGAVSKVERPCDRTRCQNVQIDLDFGPSRSMGAVTHLTDLGVLA
jgi:hypothetical protein